MRVRLRESRSSFYVWVADQDGQINAGSVKGAGATALRSQCLTERGSTFGDRGSRFMFEVQRRIGTCRIWARQRGSERQVVGARVRSSRRDRRGAQTSSRRPRARLGAGRILAVWLRVRRFADEVSKVVVIDVTA